MASKKSLTKRKKRKTDEEKWSKDKGKFIVGDVGWRGVSI